MAHPPTRERLEHLHRHPLRSFFDDEQMTSGKLNGGILVLGLLAVVGTLTGDGHPIVLVFTLLAALILWRNYRRFRERVAYALAELGFPPPPKPPRPDA